MESTGPCLGQRHVLVFLACCGFLIVYCMRINMSIALVAMVNSSALIDPNENATSVTQCIELIEPPSSSNLHRKVEGEFKWSRQMQGIILSSFFWGYGILQIPAGTFAQKYGGKWIFGFGVIITAILTILTPVVAKASVYLLIVLRVIEGLAESVTYPALTAMLGRWVPVEEAAFLNTMCTIGSSLGSIIGVISAGAICFTPSIGWEAVFYIDGAIALVWFVPWILFVFDSPIQHPRITAAERSYLRASAGSKQARANQIGVPWRNLLSDQAAWAYFIGMSAYGWAFNNILTTLPEFLSDILHFNIESNGYVTSLPFIGLVISQIGLSYLSDVLIVRTSRSRTFVRKAFTFFGFCGIAACFISLIFTGCNVIVTVFFLVMSLVCAGSLYGGLYANAIELCPEYSGSVFGISNSIATITGIVAPIATNKITETGTRDEWNTVFLLTSMIAFIGGLAYIFMGSSERRSWLANPEETEDLTSTTEIKSYFTDNIQE